MGRWTDLMFRLRALFARKTLERELDEEVAFHLDMAAEKFRAEGKSREEAEDLAREIFGHVEGHKRHTRDAWGVSMVEDLVADVRFAGRQLLRKPAFATLVVVTLALGIGGTIALWSVVQGILLRPLPFVDEQELVSFWDPGDWFGVEFDFVRETAHGFEGMTAFAEEITTLRRDRGTSMLHVVAASGDLFNVLGASPLLGSTFGPSDDLPGAEPVVVLSHGFWQQEFGSDPEVVGSRVFLGGQPATVLGVMPAGFYFPDPESRAWVPLRLDPASENYHGNGYLELIARVQEGWTTAQVEASIAALAQALGERFDYPEAWDKSRGAHVTRLREVLLGPLRPALLLLLGAVGLVLLMAGANASALLLTRTADRGAELAVRSAMGADRGRLARQLLTESLLLGLAAAIAGSALAVTLFEVLVASLPLGRGFGQSLPFEWSGLALALVLAVAVASAMTMVPIRSLSRLGGHLAEGRGQAGPGRRGLRQQKILVCVESLIAVVLLVGAMLLMRSVSQLQEIDSGLGATGVLVVDLVAGEEDLGVDERRRFFDQIIDRAAALPGVERAALTNRLPLRDDGAQGPVSVVDRPELDAGRQPSSYYRAVSPDYFQTLGIDLVEGRGFEPWDLADVTQVAVVSERFAELVWPGQSALGKRVRTGVMDDRREATVVGVAREVRVTDLVGENPPVLYRPQAQQRWPGSANILLLQTTLAPTSLAPSMRRLVNEVDPRVAVAGISSLQEVVAEKIAEPLRLRFFLGLFAVLGLVLGTVGVYGVVSYSVSRRRAEFGMHMVLGATPREVALRVVRSGLAPVVLGIFGGVFLALGLSRLLDGFLYEIEPTDPASFLLASVLLLTVGGFAALVPAWRAGRVDPSVVLRAD